MNHQYQKLPVVIEAFQMTPGRRTDNSDWPEWLHLAWNMDPWEAGSVHPNEPTPDGVLAISTLEGEMTVSWDDWIISGVHGELYPCKPDIFQKTYGRPAPADPQEAMSELEGHREGVAVELEDGLFLTADMGSTTSLSHARMYVTDRGAGLALAEAQRRLHRSGSRVISVELTIKRVVGP